MGELKIYTNTRYLLHTQNEFINVILGADHFTSEGGVGGGVGLGDFEKNIVQVHIHKKNSCTRPLCQKNSCKTVGWKKKSGKMFLELTH